MRRALGMLLLLLALGARAAAEDLPQIEEYLPPAGKGRVVVLLSGHGGVSDYRPIAGDTAKLGYYAVLLHGDDILPDAHGDLAQGGERLRAIILHARQSEHALPGKVAVIGFSRGGGGALVHATAMPDLVATVIGYYPVTNFIARYSDYKSFARQIKVPLLIFAGGEDHQGDCCRIDYARALGAAALEVGAPVELIVYPDAGHHFIGGITYRPTTLPTPGGARPPG